MANQSDVVLIGAGIMSGTLGTLIKEILPEQSITIFEAQDDVATESSNEWHNAGTGHSALCELNYTAEKADGSLEMWSYLVAKGDIENPAEFIRKLPHMSFVQGEKDVNFLRKRFEALAQHPLFEGMQFADDGETLAKWIPLMMQNRQGNEPLAATLIDHGTDVNFGELTRKLFKNLQKKAVN